MIRVALYDAKAYDKPSFEHYSELHNIPLRFLETKLNEDTVDLAKGCDAVCVFVNDIVNAADIDKLYKYGIKLVALALLLGIGVTAYAADSPLAELYFYNHSAVGGMSALNTTTMASQTEASIDNAGYNCIRYTNVPAGPSSSASVIRTLDDDAIFFISGHAGKGRVVCVDNSNNITRISASAVNNNSVYSLEYNFENTTDKLRRLRFAY